MRSYITNCSKWGSMRKLDGIKGAIIAVIGTFRLEDVRVWEGLVSMIRMS